MPEFKAELSEKLCAICNASDYLLPYYSAWDTRFGVEARAVICSQCGLVFLNPCPTNEAYLEFYKGQRNSEKEIYDVGELTKKKHHLHSLFIRLLKEALPNLKDYNVVDAGTGNGAFLHYLLPEVKSLTATEVSDKSMRQIPRLYHCPAIQTDRLVPALGESSLDLITSLAVIEHYNNPMEAIEDFFKTLRSGGKLFMYTNDILHPSLGKNENGYIKCVHPYYFSVNTLATLLERAGFRNIRAWSAPTLHSPQPLKRPWKHLPGLFALIAEKVEEPGQPTVYRDSVENVMGALQREKWFRRKRQLYVKLGKPLKMLKGIRYAPNFDPYENLAQRYKPGQMYTVN